ncbi:MAG: putative beta-lysine N-acetyltransferase [Firmicutes bacterium]|nr:putative beta-lysine N-acetyltransferase [Bacillota bacterium]
MSACKKYYLPKRLQYDQLLFSEQDPENNAKILLDFYNKRLKLLEYNSLNLAGLDNLLLKTAMKHNLEKVLITASVDDWENFLSQGYVLECLNKFYFSGKPGFHMSKFLSASRRQSSNPAEADRILQMVLQKSVTIPHALPEGYTVRPCRDEDIPAMVQLFTRVFSTYPSPVYDPAYLFQTTHTNSYYLLLINDRKQIVSIISAEINKRYSNAEVTDCSTLPEYRGKGFMSALLAALEKEIKKRGITNLYSIARATSPGINTVLRRHDYTYGGRFIKNCNISGGFEDMNLWFKQLNHWQY